jgi:hypothetical protein
MGVIGKDLGVPYGECGHNHSAALFLCMDRGPGRATLFRLKMPLQSTSKFVSASMILAIGTITA